MSEKDHRAKKRKKSVKAKRRSSKKKLDVVRVLVPTVPTEEEANANENDQSTSWASNGSTSTSASGASEQKMSDYTTPSKSGTTRPATVSPCKERVEVNGHSPEPAAENSFTNGSSSSNSRSAEEENKNEGNRKKRRVPSLRVRTVRRRSQSFRNNERFFSRKLQETVCLEKEYLSNIECECLANEWSRNLPLTPPPTPQARSTSTTSSSGSRGRSRSSPFPLARSSHRVSLARVGTFAFPELW